MARMNLSGEKRMRIVIAALLILHGAIHLIGFVEATSLAASLRLRGDTSIFRPESRSPGLGVAWMFPFAAFVGAAILMLLRKKSWWFVAIVGIVVSQVLVFDAWPEASAGTLVNLVLLVPAIISWADARFDKNTDQQVRSLLDGSCRDDVEIVTPDSLETLPAPVRRWLENASVVGKQVPRTVCLAQRGELCLGPDKPQVPAVARQCFRLDEPAFVWRVRVRMMRALPVAGRDTYINGRGRMVIKAVSLIPLVDMADEKIDQGALLRFLGEIVWFPAAALSSYLRWDPIDATTARATMTYGGRNGTAVFSFDDKGRFISLTADRYFGGGADATIEKWEVIAREWRFLNGCRVPTRGEVRWKLAAGDFTFYRWEITALEYDPGCPGGARV